MFQPEFLKFPPEYLDIPNGISSYSNMERRCSKSSVADGRGLTFVGANGRLTDISPQAHSCMHLPPHTQMQSKNTEVRKFKTPDHMNLMRWTICNLIFWLRALNQKILSRRKINSKMESISCKKPQKSCFVDH